ncbi:hypothetical protein ACOBV8_18610 (plasmid) [Pseudoalteromonas espejiana]
MKAIGYQQSLPIENYHYKTMNFKRQQHTATIFLVEVKAVSVNPLILKFAKSNASSRWRYLKNQLVGMQLG